MEIDLMELFTEAGQVRADIGVGLALFIDELQDSPAHDISAICGACHELCQTGGPLIVVGAGLPHLPSVLSAPQELLRTAVPVRIDRSAAPGLGRSGADRPGRSGRGAKFTTDALTALYKRPTGTRISCRRTARSPGTWPRTARYRERRRWPARRREAELAVGFFGCRYERATPAEREHARHGALGDEPVPTARSPTSSAASRPACPRPGTA